MAKKEVKNRMYYLYELKDTYTKSIEDLTELNEHDKRLILLIETSAFKNDEMMKTEASGLKDSVKFRENTIASMNRRLGIINKFITDYEKKDAYSETLALIITKFIEATAKEDYANTQLFPKEEENNTAEEKKD